MQTRQQADALLAYNHIKGVKELGNDDLIDTYARAANRFPILIRQNGLQQTLGFYAGKAKGATDNAEGAFLDHIALVLGIGDQLIQETILDASLPEYMYYTRRCLEVAVWYRRFTESILGIDATGNATEDADNTSKEALHDD